MATPDNDPKTTAERVGATIRAARIAAGYSQTAAAAALGISRGTVRRYEKGKISVEQLAELAELLDTDLALYMTARP